MDPKSYDLDEGLYRSGDRLSVYYDWVLIVNNCHLCFPSVKPDHVNKYYMVYRDQFITYFDDYIFFDHGDQNRIVTVSSVFFYTMHDLQSQTPWTRGGVDPLGDGDVFSRETESVDDGKGVRCLDVRPPGFPS